MLFFHSFITAQSQRGIFHRYCIIVTGIVNTILHVNSMTMNWKKIYDANSRIVYRRDLNSIFVLKEVTMIYLHCHVTSAPDNYRIRYHRHERFFGKHFIFKLFLVNSIEVRHNINSGINISFLKKGRRQHSMITYCVK